MTLSPIVDVSMVNSSDELDEKNLKLGEEYKNAEFICMITENISVEKSKKCPNPNTM
jgi:hypothetical protein